MVFAFLIYETVSLCIMERITRDLTITFTCFHFAFEYFTSRYYLSSKI